MNGLSDHDAQIMNLNTLYNKKPHEYQTYYRRNITKYIMAESQNSLKYESWDQVFDGTDVNKVLNSFLNTYLRIFMPISHTHKKK